MLRPGGRELTEELLRGLQINTRDDVVEFAPGVGFTADLLAHKKPKSYRGIELNGEAFKRLKVKFKDQERFQFMNRSASSSGIPSQSADKVIGEAMLTMQANHRKSEIIAEAYRILRPEGLYGIHELALQPEELADEIKEEIRVSLARTLRVDARPLTKEEWGTLLAKEGFEIKEAYAAPMHLLEPNRMIADEGILGAMRIASNLMANPKAKRKVSEMRELFKKYEKNLTAIAIVAQKVVKQ